MAVSRAARRNRAPEEWLAQSRKAAKEIQVEPRRRGGTERREVAGYGHGERGRRVRPAARGPVLGPEARCRRGPGVSSILTP